MTIGASEFAQNMKRRLMLGGMLVWASAAAQAAPDATAKYLMHEPASLMDFGIYKMEQALVKAIPNSGTSFGVSASYSWDENKIIITIFDAAVRETRNVAIETCKKYINSTRVALSVDAETGKPYFEQFMKYVAAAHYFRHEGFTSDNAPNSLVGDINRMTEITVSVMFDGEKAENPPVRCKAPLLGNEVLISE